MMNKGRTAIFSILLSVFAIGSFGASASAEKANDAIKPFNAIYDMYRQGDKLGQGERALKKITDNQYSLSLKSELKWLIFSDKRKEVSVFTVSDGENITPNLYTFDRSGTGSDEEVKISFNSDQSLIVNPKAKKDAAPDEWQQGWQDEMSLHAQIQLDLINNKSTFNYTVVSNSGKLREYLFEVIGEELISTGFGRFKAIKVARVYEGKKFYAQHAWFIPELNYTLARLWRMKKGVEQYDLVIKSFTVVE